MASPKQAVDLVEYLITTVGLSNVYIDGFVPTPVNQTTIQEYSGPPPVRVHGSTSPNIALDEGVFQISVRDKTKQTCRTNIHTIVDALDGLKDVTINGVVYTYIQSISRPRFLKTNEDGSVEFVWEIRVQSRR